MQFYPSLFASSSDPLPPKVSPKVIEPHADNPDRNKDYRLQRCKDGSPYHHKATDEGKNQRNSDEGLVRAMKIRLSGSQKDGT